MKKVHAILASGLLLNGPPTEPASEDTSAQSIPLQAIRAAAPAYPRVALVAQVEGYVLLELQIDSGGKPIGSRMLRTPALLGEAAEAAAMRWQFALAAEGDPDVRKVGLKMVFRLVSPEAPEAAVSAVFSGPYEVEVRGEKRPPREEDTKRGKPALISDAWDPAATHRPHSRR